MMEMEQYTLISNPLPWKNVLVQGLKRTMVKLVQNLTLARCQLAFQPRTPTRRGMPIRASELHLSALPASYLESGTQ